MVNILYVLLALLIGVSASCIWFGFIVIFSNLSRRNNIKWIRMFITTLASTPLLIAIFFIVGFIPFNFTLSSILISLAIVIVTVLLCVVIIYFRNSHRSKFGKDLLLWGFDGVLMEISQRLMMQSLLYGILTLFNVPYIKLLTVICTAIVWCVALFLQNRIEKKDLNKDFLIEVIASLVFSLGIGWAYQITGFIVVSMIGHFFERILSNIVLRKKFHDHK